MRLQAKYLTKEGRTSDKQRTLVHRLIFAFSICINVLIDFLMNELK